MSALRIPVAVASGFLCSLAVFIGLWQLVDVPFVARAVVVGPGYDFTSKRPTRPPENKRIKKVEREPPPVVPTNPGGRLTSSVNPTPTPFFHTTAIVPPTRGKGLPIGVDRDAVPLVRIEPDYPQRAITRGTEGWVQVQFTVTTIGTVRDAVVVASEPDSVFDAAALEAVQRWRYQARVDGGIAVERVGLQTKFIFTLPSEQR